MSALRSLGLLCLCVGGLACFLLFARLRISRSAFLLFEFGVAVGLVVVLDPETVTAFSEFLLGRGPYRRLLALLLISSAFLWASMLAREVSLRTVRSRLDRTVRAFERERFLRDANPQPSPGCLVVAIPAHNEEEAIGDLVSGIPRFIAARTVIPLVLDDGSSDRTPERARAAGAVVVPLTFRRGQGAALRLASDLARLFEAEVLITMDGDGQHRADEIGQLVNPILNDRADFVVGSRRLGTEFANHPLRRFGVRFFSAIVRWSTGMPVTDCASGFRALRLASISKLRLEEDQYQTLEFLLEARRAGLRYREVPVTIEARHAGASKKGPTLLYGLRFTKALLRSLFR